jgi:hypothetical protein
VVFVVLALLLPLAGCAGSKPGPGAQPTHPTWLAGTWEGHAWQVGASKWQGDAPVSVTFVSGGAWQASTPSGTWSGTSALVGDRLVLDGLDPTGAKIRYTLKERQTAGGHELWGMVEADFGAALLSLKRIR